MSQSEGGESDRYEPGVAIPLPAGLPPEYYDFRNYDKLKSKRTIDDWREEGTVELPQTCARCTKRMIEELELTNKILVCSFTFSQILFQVALCDPAFSSAQDIPGTGLLLREATKCMSCLYRSAALRLTAIAKMRGVDFIVEMSKNPTRHVNGWDLRTLARKR